MLNQTHPAQNLIEALRSANQTLAVAESCTGGSLGAALTDISGSSAVFMGGIIAYDNSIKINILKVRQQTLADHGAVSAECATEMAAAVKALFKTTAGISITGIAGPNGGTKQKPVGTVYIGTVFNNEKLVRCYHFDGNRTEIRQQSVEAALKQLCCHSERILSLKREGEES